MYFLKRILTLLPLTLLITLLAFVLVRVSPGGPFDKERAPASPEIEKQLRAKYHLDESWPRQYLRFLGGAVRGDLGPSLKYRNHNVTDILLQGLPVSALLGTLAFGFAMGLGIPWGVFMAVRRGEGGDHTAGFLALLAVCVPGFVIGPLLVMVLAIKLDWFPVALWASPWHAVLPTMALGLFYAGKISRLLRESMSGVLHLEFVTAARARGVGNPALLMKHALRVAILPVVSYSGPMLADLLTGSFVIENLFQIPGIGVFLVNSLQNRDYPMTAGLVMVFAVLLLTLNLLVDLLYVKLDRRVKLE
ncbi:MAG: ABC transporter permease [Verrucomicrobia bacterium]|nr:ABC transporter permease [Verrucomicrobiota bacterium]